MSNLNDPSYTDAKGRRRWRRNDEIAEKLKQLYDILVIGGYPESHATRYPQLAHTISRYPEPIDRLHEEGRLTEIPGIGGIVSGIIGEFLETGTCTKLEKFTDHMPRSVLELTAIPRLGAKTARVLYADLGIDGLAALDRAIDEDRLEGIKGIGKKTLETMREHIRRKRDSDAGGQSGRKPGIGTPSGS